MFCCWIIVYWPDSLAYEIKSEDVYKESFKHKIFEKSLHTQKAQKA